MKKTALFVIDVQQGLFEKKIPIYKAEQVLDNINNLIDKARKANVPVIFIQHANDGWLATDSEGWQLHPAIQPDKDETIIHKRHGNAFEKTELQCVLEKQDINHLILTGLVTHGCVRATTLGALELGYQVIVVGDGHSSFSKDAPKLIEKWNHTFKEKGAKIIRTMNIQFL